MILRKEMRHGRPSFAARLFFVLFLLSAVPSVALLGLAAWGIRAQVELGGAAAWRRVGDTGSELLGALDEAGADSLVQAAAERHEDELSRSVQLARRWDLIAGRLAGARASNHRRHRPIASSRRRAGW